MLISHGSGMVQLVTGPQVQPTSMISLILALIVMMILPMPNYSYSGIDSSSLHSILHTLQEPLPVQQAQDWIH
jgi:hypothetical protein